MAAAAIGVGGSVIIALAGFWANVRNTNKTTEVSKRAVQAAQRTVELTDHGQVADRYTKAIEQLGSDKLDVRIGAIYALERVAQDSPERDHPTVMEVLAAFIREHCREQWQEAKPGAAPPLPTTRPDIQAATVVIGRRDVQYDIQRVDLVHVKLPRVRLTQAKLSDVQLAHADLTGADLTDAVLTGANLFHTNLRLAHLNGANLTKADLSRAYLNEAHLTGAILVETKLTKAHLRIADLSEADLIRADFTGADLTGAKWPSDALVPEGWQRDADGRLVGGAPAD